MKRVGLIGSGIGYSVSPVMHNAAFAGLNLDWTYELLDTDPNDLDSTIQHLREEPWMGANVTIPFKQRVIPFLDSISRQAEITGAVNTIIRRGSSLHGVNTDIKGFALHLQDLGWLEQHRSALIFGAGGAARAAALALLEKGFSVIMIARTPSRADSFQAALAPSQRQRLSFKPWRAGSTRGASADNQIVINATPLGSMKLAGRNPWPPSLKPEPGMHFYDMTYNPPLTPFLKFGRSHGLQVSNGLGMLLRQGALAFELWTGTRPDLEHMRAAAEQKLEEYNASISDSR